MRNRQSRARPVWGMGVRVQNWVKLDSVLEAKARGGCLRNCLRRWTRGTFWTSDTWLGDKNMRSGRGGLCRCSMHSIRGQRE